MRTLAQTLLLWKSVTRADDSLSQTLMRLPLQRSSEFGGVLGVQPFLWAGSFLIFIPLLPFSLLALSLARPPHPTPRPQVPAASQQTSSDTYLCAGLSLFLQDASLMGAELEQRDVHWKGQCSPRLSSESVFCKPQLLNPTRVCCRSEGGSPRMTAETF